MENERLWIHLPKQEADRLRVAAKELNLNLSQFLAMCVAVGSGQVISRLSPDTVTPKLEYGSGDFLVYTHES